MQTKFRKDLAKKNRYEKYVTIYHDKNEASIIEAYERCGAKIWRLASFNRTGLPDLWINPPNGPGFFVEVKTATGTLSEPQKKFRAHTKVHVVRTSKEVRRTLGESSSYTSPPSKRRNSFKTKIRKSRRKNRLFGPAIRKWQETGAEVWVLERLDNGLPHFWVKRPNSPGFFAHIGSFGNTAKQQLFSTYNEVFEDMGIHSPRSKYKRKHYPRSRPKSSGCLVAIAISSSMLLLTFLYIFIW